MRWFFVGLTLLVSTPASAESTRCSLSFAVVTDVDHEGIPAGSRLQGTIEFLTEDGDRLSSEAVSYRGDGVVRVAAPDGTAVAGKIGVVHVVRRSHTADYVSFDATKVAGDLGGQRSYADPMLVTLYAPPLTLETFDLPADTAGWNRLGKRQFFQVHTPDANATLRGNVSNLTGKCE